MRLRNLVIILAILGGVYYFELLPRRQAEPVAEPQVDQGRVRHLRAIIRYKQGVIAQMEGHEWQSRASLSDADRKKVYEMRKEIAAMEAEIASGR